MAPNFYIVNLTGDESTITIRAHELKCKDGYLSLYMDGELTAKYAKRSVKGYRIVKPGSSEYSRLDYAVGR